MLAAVAVARTAVLLISCMQQEAAPFDSIQLVCQPVDFCTFLITPVWLFHAKLYPDVCKVLNPRLKLLRTMTYTNHAGLSG